MQGFDVDKNLNVIRQKVEEHYRQARQDVLSVLTSDGYKEILKDIEISDDFTFFRFKFKDGVDITQQDFIEVLAQGGAVKKDDDFIEIAPSSIMRKYLGKR